MLTESEMQDEVHPKDVLHSRWYLRACRVEQKELKILSNKVLTAIMSENLVEAHRYAKQWSEMLSPRIRLRELKELQEHNKIRRAEKVRQIHRLFADLERDRFHASENAKELERIKKIVDLVSIGDTNPVLVWASVRKKEMLNKLGIENLEDL